MKTRDDIEGGYTNVIPEEHDKNNPEWSAQMHDLRTMHEIACQLADMNQTLANGNNLQVVNSDGAVVIRSGNVLITKPATAAAMTLTVPVAGTEDGNILRFVPTVANAHTITTSAGGFNGNKSICTLVPPSSGLFIAYNGVWYLVGPMGGTLSG